MLNRFSTCDFASFGRVAIYLLCLLLPVSIALAESFAGLVIFLYLLNRWQEISQAKGLALSLRIRKWLSFRSSSDKDLDFIYLALRFHLIAIIISTCLSLNHTASLFGLIGKGLEGILLFLAIKQFITKPAHVYKLILIWIAAVAVISASGLCQWYTGQDFLRGFALTQGRVSATFRHANDFGAYLLVLLPLLLWFVFDIFFNRKDQRKAGFLKEGFKLPGWLKVGLILFAFIVSVAALGLTFSRSSWLAFMICGFFLFGFQKRFLICFVIVIALFITFFSPLMIKVRDVSLITDNVYVQKPIFQKIMNLDYLVKHNYGIVSVNDFIGIDFKIPNQDIYDGLVAAGYINNNGRVLNDFWQLESYQQMKAAYLETDEEKEAVFNILTKSTFWKSLYGATISRLGQGRYVYWEEAFGIIRDYPFWGSGLNTYSIVAPHYKINWGGYAHNSYLQMFAEIGLFGLGTFLWLLYALFKYAFDSMRKLAKASLSYWIIRSLVFGFGAYLIQSFFDSTFYSVQLGLLLWISMGILLAVTRSLSLHKIDK